MSGFHRYYVDMAHIFFVKIRKHVPLILGLVIGFLAFWKWPGGLIAGAIFAVVAYVATRSPISNTYARFQNAEGKKRDNMIRNNQTFFNPWETIFYLSMTLLANRNLLI